MHISVIIPTHNEEALIASTIAGIKRNADNPASLEIIVADGESTDQTIPEAKKAGAIIINVPRKRRSTQMNAGAKAADGAIFYFLHADTIPPLHFDRHIINSFNQGAQAGCFRLSFDRPDFLLKFYAWCTKFDVDAFRFGDQSLFITKKTFMQLKGFREDHLLMEDQEMIKRIKSSYPFALLPQKVITSARKYSKNGKLRLQIIFTFLFLLYKAGVKQRILFLLYHKLIH